MTRQNGNLENEDNVNYIYSLKLKDTSKMKETSTMKTSLKMKMALKLKMTLKLYMTSKMRMRRTQKKTALKIEMSY